MSVEEIKTSSHGLRGAIREELAVDAAPFTKGAATILKFHGIYQQDDRDARKAGPKTYSAMVRVSVPGGILGTSKYQALDALADRVGDGTLRITSRGGVQYHYVGKTDLPTLMAALGQAGISTFAACGDVVRNVVFCAAPFQTPERQALWKTVREVDRALKPRTRAYAEIWLDGEPAASWEEVAEPLYGAAYLPRKFKIGFALEGENTTDIYSDDLGFVALRRGGFAVLAGGGMGQTNGRKDTHPRAADVLGSIAPEDLLETARAAVSIHRDYGNRADRKKARLKYVLEERGLEWFREELAARLGKPLGAAPPLEWLRHADYLGWHEQGDGRWFFGLRVVSGRIAGSVRAAIREVVDRLRPEVRFTPQQNLIFAGVEEGKRADLERILRRHAVPLPGEIPMVLRHSMACPALPTCGLALTESERVLPDVAGQIEREWDAAGMREQPIHVRMTGCPNGCARPYTAEIGIVGMSPGLYSLYVGGSPMATRVAPLWKHNVKQAEIGRELRVWFRRYAAERHAGEAFGDFAFRLKGVPCDDGCVARSR